MTFNESGVQIPVRRASPENTRIDDKLDLSQRENAEEISLSAEASLTRLTETDPARRWLDTSSWMTSFVLHLICFLLITSIAVPWAAQSASSGSREGITLTLGFADTDRDADGQSQSISIEPSPETDDGKQETATPSEQPSGSAPTAQNEPQQAQNQQPNPVQARRQQSQSIFGRWVTQRMTEPIQVDSSSKYAAILNRKRENIETSSRPAQLQTSDTIAAEILDAKQLRYDKVVNDFIKYDIGQLRGKAGQAARKRFMNLGSDAIPALVRGLNKSAGIHASCPVGVIAGKLIQSLRGVSDSSLSEYAMENIGRDIPEDAPHYRRILAFRRRWLGQTNQVPEAVAAVVAEQTMRDDGQLLELVLALSEAPVDTLIAALESGDQRLCCAAMIALTRNRTKLPNLQQSRLVGALSRLSHSVETQQEKALVKEAISSVQSRI
ncbi:MAG: hypothetical protein GY768_10210 [Planctomycetaceae bacterium]|nr:hypothetical protein [Planctomycetaceae bacterium]